MAVAYSPAVPFMGFLGAPFVNGNKVEIDGMVLPLARSFEVNLKTSDGQTYLHVNPRFEQDVLVLNSKIASNGGWGKEERVSGLPKGIRRGAGFSLIIESQRQGLVVFVNNDKVHVFVHRADPGNIDIFEVRGEVSLQLVRVHTANLPVPHRAPIRGRLQTGRHIFICGTMTGNNFSVNLKSGEEVLLHLNPRADQNCVVCNAFIGGKWGTEEIAAKAMPFKEGQPFHIQIITDEGKFIIVVNNEYYSEFAFRSHGQVDNVEVNGDVQLHSCTC